MDSVITAPARHRLDVDDYYRMAEAGILNEDSRVELIDGDIIDMAPIGLNHSSMVGDLNMALAMACGSRGILRPQLPVRLSRYDEPQPDFAVVRPRPDRYRSGHPGAADILLLVEVSDSSLRYDRTVKLPLYARAGVPEYWLVDIKGRVLEAYRQPSPEGYGEMIPHGATGRLPLLAAPDIVVTLDLIFG